MKDADELKQALEGLGPGFRFVRELGRGTTAIVYLVEDDELGRELAVKVIRSSFIHDDEAMARLQREARLVAQMQHPNIVKLFGTRHLPDGSMALLMEHVPGRNLREVLLDEGPLTASRAMNMLREIASALAYAHRRRIVHRDVKPENIYIDEEIGTARLADFGVARPWDRDARLTLPGESLGTPAYMSPEQIDAQEVDGRSDVYSLGLVGYEMLAGKHPWEAENLYSMIFKQKHEQLPPLHTLRPDVPEQFAEILRKALHKEPDGRWETAEEFHKQLSRIVIDEIENPFLGVLELSGDGSPAEMGGQTWETMSEEMRPREAWQPSAGVARKQKRRKSRKMALFALPLLLAGTAGAWWATRPGGLLSNLNSQTPSAAATGADGLDATPSLPMENLDGLVSPPTLMVLQGDRAAGTVGEDLQDSLVVRLADGFGGTMVGEAVIYRIIEGGGILGETVLMSDSMGLTRAGLTLPDVAGPITVFATLRSDSSVAARFDVLAIPGPPAEVSPVRGGGQSAVVGQGLSTPLEVEVIDEFGNRVPGATVRFDVVEGGGQTTPSVARTDSLGRATSRWRLGSGLGGQRIAARVESAPNVVQVFEANALPEAASEDPPPVQSNPTTSVPTGPVSVARRAVAVGGNHVCVISATGAANCRGANERGQQSGGSGVTFQAITAGVNHTCGLERGGTAHCWGSNENGQLGDGGTDDSSSASPVESDFGFAFVVAGQGHTCGLDSEGGAHCWGRNLNGQVGDGTGDDRTTPQRVNTPRRFKAIAAGWNHTCAVENGGTPYCWGLNDYGQLGDGTKLDRESPVAVTGVPPLDGVAGGASHACGVGEGTVYCWGRNNFGQVGDGSKQDKTTPVAVDLPSDARTVVAGALHSCASLVNGSVWCWGRNAQGQLGDGTFTERLRPVEVVGNHNFVQLQAGGSVTCGVRGDGTEWCWGFNQFGQLGDRTRTDKSSPTVVGG